MLAFALAVALFAGFAVIGAPVVAALNTRRDLVRNILIAPAVGVVVVLVSTYLMSRIGLPVRSFARWLTPVLLAAAIAWLLWLRPIIPVRRVLPFVAIAGFAFVVTGWPLFRYGFAWLGTLNPDMAHYALGAQRLVDEAFIQDVDADAWARQTDWSIYYIGYQISGVRSGAELLLAWTIALTGETGHAVFMPLILAFHVVLIWAATALISVQHRFARVLAASLLACSAMLTLGVTTQLLGQVLGLTLLALAATLCLTPFYRYAPGPRAQFVALAGLVMAAFFLGYPETLPFFGLAFLIYHGLGMRREWRYAGRALIATACIGAVGCALVAADLLGLLRFMIGQVTSSTSTMQLAEAFPYLLIPSGFAAVWGLRHYVSTFGSDASVAIAAGMALSLGATAGAAWMALRREPTAAITVVMLGLVPALFSASSGFGMYKIAMYLQPFLLPTTVLALCLTLRAAR